MQEPILSNHDLKTVHANLMQMSKAFDEFSRGSEVDLVSEQVKTHHTQALRTNSDVDFDLVWEALENATGRTWHHPR